MPGRPKLRRLERYIEEEMGGENYVFNAIADGKPIREIAESLRGCIPESPEFPSRPMIYQWLKRDGAEHRMRKWRDAQKIAAHIHVEDSEEILRNNGEPPRDSAHMTQLKELAGHKRYLAERFNRDEYGEQPAQHEVNVNFGDLYLEELRNSGSMPAKDEPEAIEADYEVEDADRQALPADS